MFPWCLSCRLVTGPKFLPQPYIVFALTLLIMIGAGILFWTSVSSHLIGKCQTLTYIKSCKYVGLYQVDSFPIVCVVVALDRWNYCSREQGPTAKHPLLSVCHKASLSRRHPTTPVVSHFAERKLT